MLPVELKLANVSTVLITGAVFFIRYPPTISSPTIVFFYAFPFLSLLHFLGPTLLGFFF